MFLRKEVQWSWGESERRPVAEVHVASAVSLPTARPEVASIGGTIRARRGKRGGAAGASGAGGLRALRAARELLHLLLRLIYLGLLSWSSLCSWLRQGLARLPYSAEGDTRRAPGVPAGRSRALDSRSAAQARRAGPTRRGRRCAALLGAARLDRRSRSVTPEMPRCIAYSIVHISVPIPVTCHITVLCSTLSTCIARESMLLLFVHSRV